jgi:hypothetical protein
MFKPTDRQQSLFTGARVLGAGSRARLEATWAQGFRASVLPVLLELEPRFADLYDADTGRGSWSVARKLGVLLLKEFLSLTDQASVDSLLYDLRWQHALALGLDDAYLSRRSLVDFRRRLVACDPEMARLREVFDRIGADALKSLGLSTADQRLDSTHITSNIQCGGRVSLFRRTLEHFGAWLAKRWPDKVVGLSPSLQTWWKTDRDGWFGAGTKEEQRAKLVEMSQWLAEIEQTFVDDTQVRRGEPFELVVRVLDEHCERTKPRARIEVGPGGSGTADAADAADGADAANATESDDPVMADETGLDARTDVTVDAEANAATTDTAVDGSAAPAPVKVLAKPAAVSPSLQSPHDPDAAYGHKGTGYHVQITETCHAGALEGPKLARIVTDFDVQPAHINDCGRAAEVLERLHARGLLPERLFADGGYASGAALLHAESLGVDLYTPVVRTRMPADTLGREAFDLDSDGTVRTCPAGHAPKRHTLRSSRIETTPTTHVYFHGATCRACPLMSRCAARPPNNGRKGDFHLELLDRLIARDLNFQRQQTPEWRTNYSIRSGIEATNSEMKRSHGLGKLSVRRLPRVRLAVTCKLIACNIKRWLRALQEAPAKPSRPLWPALPARDAISAAVARLTRHLARRALRYHPMHHRPALRAA